MLRGFAVALFTLLSAATASAETARIATWNLGGFHRIPESKLPMIVKGLKALDADIVVLPELNPASHAEKIAEMLADAGAGCHSSEVPDQPLARQQIGFIFKCDVEVVNPRLIEGSDLGRQGYRNAAVADVKIGSFDFVLIGVHLKASRGPTNRDARSFQVAYINGYIQGILYGGERDVLVIGDYNMIPEEDDENFVALNGGEVMRFVSSEDLAGEFSHISGGRPGNLLDGYGFTNVDPAEYLDGTVHIVQLHALLGLTLGEFANQVTDHLPVVAQFETSVDND